MTGLALMLAGCASEPTWTEYGAESGRFAIEMPGNPEMEDATAPSPDGELDLRIAAVEIGDSAFAASETAFPEGFPISLEGAAEGTVANSMDGLVTSSSEVEVDVAKIDPFNHVPIIIGMEPGTSYHDDIREWCGDLFTGTFDFRVTSCFDPHYIPVDCGGA